MRPLNVRWIGILSQGSSQHAGGLRAALNTLRRLGRATAFISPRDIGLFLRSARTDAGIARDRVALGEQHAFDAAYADGDPWASGDARYLYQRRKYEVLAGLLPPGRRFGQALDIGSGHGLLGRRIAARADSVLGIDISQNAVEQARMHNADLANLHFERCDIRDLPASYNGRFDLVMLTDMLYYLPHPLTDAAIKAVALRVGGLLAPDGLLLLANHFFFAGDRDSRLSRRIHRAFAWSPAFDIVSEHRRPFYLVSLLAQAPGGT